ncbi:hypothetical protein FYZ48_11115 [Gimesia chilikensis]|uniref:hypothetical protein n=1 Tax=Gimesia chilikensis TaxID=2605989 RepID=UPI0011F02058|nr:hypothetical protein [Gimesia chilikensis]KAA0139183.1 hypothetical protein FYZ48_11115 [Gimesia chilikensis]
MKKKANRKVSNCDPSIEISPPIQITNIPQPKEAEIKEASIKLNQLIETSLIIVDKKRSNKKMRPFRDKILQAEIEAIDQKVEDETRKDALDVVSVLMKCLHEFANVSDICILDINPQSLEELSLLSLRKPLRLIGTSAHHAAALFLQQCLANDFMNHYPEVLDKWVVIRNSIDPQLLLARIDWERMKRFKITVSGHAEPDKWITNRQIREEITRYKHKLDHVEEKDLIDRATVQRRLNKFKPKPKPDFLGDNNVHIWKLKTIKPCLESVAKEVPPERWDEIALGVAPGVA